MKINLGVLVELKAKTSTRFRFQNYKVGEDVTYGGLTWTFAPFSFSGVVSNLSGDNLGRRFGLSFPLHRQSLGSPSATRVLGWHCKSPATQ